MKRQWVLEERFKRGRMSKCVLSHTSMMSALQPVRFLSQREFHRFPPPNKTELDQDNHIF